jgi:hypothetical protein
LSFQYNQIFRSVQSLNDKHTPAISNSGAP